MFSLNDLWDATFQLLEKWHRIAVKNKLINISPNFSSSFLFIENFLSFSQFSLSFSLIFRLIHTCSNPSLTYPHNLILFTGINQSVVYDHNAFSFIHTRFLLSYHFTHTLYEAFQSFMTMFYFFFSLLLHIIIIIIFIVIAFHVLPEIFFIFFLPFLSCAKEAKVREELRIFFHIFYWVSSHSHDDQEQEWMWKNEEIYV